MALASRTYSSELSQLTAMRAFVGETCRREWTKTADEPAIRQLQLAVAEAAANVIRHAYQGVAGRPMALMLETHPDQIRLTLYHNGLAFDSKSAPPPAFDGSSEGGFGVYMIEQLTDEVTYFQDVDGRCAVYLVKNRSKRLRE